MRARSFGETRAKIAMLLYGEQFTGKSTMAAQFAYMTREDGKPFRVLYIDAESGSIDDYAADMIKNGVDPNNIYVVYTQSLQEVKECIRKVKEHEDFYQIDDEGNETDSVVVDSDGKPFRADAIVVDGTTVLDLTTKQGLIEFSKKRAKVKANQEELMGEEKLVKVEQAGLELKDYQTIKFKGQDLILDLMASGVHFAVTAREKDETVTKRDKNGSFNSEATGRKIPDGFKDIMYNVKTVLRLFRDEDGVVCAKVEKDRTGVHQAEEVIEDPTLLDWQLVIDKTASAPEHVLKNDLNKSVETEQKLYAKEVMNSVGEAVDDSPADSSMGDAVTALKKEIRELQKKVPAPRKKSVQDALKAAGIPVAIKEIDSADTLKKYIDILQKTME